MGSYLEVPKTIGIIEKGMLKSMTKESKSFDALIHIAKEKNGLILKPISGGGWVNIFLLEIKGDKLLLNKEVVSYSKLYNLFNKLDGFLISEFVQQGEYANNIFSQSTNTIRLVTVVDPETQTLLFQ